MELTKGQLEVMEAGGHFSSQGAWFGEDHHLHPQGGADC